MHDSMHVSANILFHVSVDVLIDDVPIHAEINVLINKYFDPYISV